MLVNSFDTKFGKTASKYELLDKTFIDLLKKKRSFSRIFTSVVINKKIDYSIKLRSDITSQILSSVVSQDPLDKYNLYYMGDVFKKDIFSLEIKQFREHGIEVINQPKLISFNLITEILIKYLKLVLKSDFHFVFTDPNLKNNKKFILTKKNNNTGIQGFVNHFDKNFKNIPYTLNPEKNFFSKDYHQDIFFYVYSNKTKKILSQGGGYTYKKNNKTLNGFGFSCNIDDWVEHI